MPSVTFFKFRFTPSWLMSLLTVLFCVLFIRLGYWQIHRADEKAKMLAAEQKQEKLKPILWRAQQHVPRQYQRVQVEGRYVPQVFFLDNQHHQHQFGYNVLTPLELGDGSIVMIDRGWVPGDITRRVFPHISMPQGGIQLYGAAYFPNKNQWVLGPALEVKGQNTVILERFDAQLVKQVLQKTVYPFIIRLDKQDPYGFVREWETVSMPPQRHLAYALQWFAMALVILIIFIALNLKKKNEETAD